MPIYVTRGRNSPRSASGSEDSTGESPCSAFSFAYAQPFARSVWTDNRGRAMDTRPFGSVKCRECSGICRIIGASVGRTVPRIPRILRGALRRENRGRLAPRIRPPRGQTLNRHRLRTVAPIPGCAGEDRRNRRTGRRMGWYRVGRVGGGEGRPPHGHRDRLPPVYSPHGTRAGGALRSPTLHNQKN